MSSISELTPARIAEIAHELRSPLGGIEAMVSMLENSPLDTEQASIVKALKASVAHLRGIANAVLVPSGKDAEGGSSGASSVGDAAAADECHEQEDVGLDEFMTEFATACLARARTRKLDFHLAIEAGARASSVPDAGGLRQVLENLVDNAFRLMLAGRVELRVARRGEGRLVFRVSDQGPGLDATDADRLIREGGRLEGRTGGAGLGLSIAGRIVRRHGGILSGGPRPEDAGAVFTFDWPCHGAASEGECLIVDDHPASRMVLRTILEAAGYACIEATGADEAFALVKSRSPALVLTDLNMPGENGRALIERVAGLQASLRPKLVVVSADDVDSAHPVHPLIDGAIRKPITVRAVLETVASLRQQGQNRAA